MVVARSAGGGATTGGGTARSRRRPGPWVDSSASRRLSRLDLAPAAVEGLVEVGEGLGQRLARRPGGLGLLGLDRPELLDRLPQRRDHGLGLLEQAPPALGLELQLVPQRRELLDQIDQPELARRRPRPASGPRPVRAGRPRPRPGRLQPVAERRGGPRRPRSGCRSWRVREVKQGGDREPGIPRAGARRSAARRLERVGRGLGLEELGLQPAGRVAQRLVGGVDGRERSGARSGGNSRTSSRYRRRISASPASGSGPGFHRGRSWVLVTSSSACFLLLARGRPGPPAARGREAGKAPVQHESIVVVELVVVESSSSSSSKSSIVEEARPERAAAEGTPKWSNDRPRPR